MSSTRSIRTSSQQVACDVCGRTLLRGERVEIYLAGGSRRSVCELCTARALHGGWVREGTVPDYGESSDRGERRRSLLGRRRRGRRSEAELVQSPPPFADLDEDEATPPLNPEPAEGPEPFAAPQDDEREPAPDWPDPPPRAPRRGRPGRSRRAVPFGPRQDAAAARQDAGPREPRHVHAVPTSIEHRIEAAVELFNRSEYPRTVAGIGRSLGLPDVAVHPASPPGAVVVIVVRWELCWYRYEVDLSEENPVVRAAGQGYELSDLSELERQTNVAASGQGLLTA